MHLAYVAVFLCQVRFLFLFHLVSFLVTSGNYVVYGPVIFFDRLSSPVVKSQSYDLVVIGAGPAGSFAAEKLASAGNGWLFSTGGLWASRRLVAEE